MTAKDIALQLKLDCPQLPIRLCIEAAQHSTTTDEAKKYLSTHYTRQTKIDEVFK